MTIPADCSANRCPEAVGQSAGRLGCIGILQSSAGNPRAQAKEFRLDVLDIACAAENLTADMTVCLVSAS